MHVKTAKYFRSIKFSSLTESEYDGLLERGMLYEYYPQATGNFMKDMINENIRESRIDIIGQNGNNGDHYDDNPDGIDLSPQAEHNVLWPYGVGDDYIDKVYNNNESTKDHMFDEPCRGHDMISEERSKESKSVSFVNDSVHKPSHYEIGNTGMEAIDVIQATLTKEEFKGYCKGNILKYSLRANKKNGDEDLKKADVYSGWLLEGLE